MPVPTLTGRPDASDGSMQDVMQVCRNGHVITDLLQYFPRARPEPLRPLRRDHARSPARPAAMGLGGGVFVPGLVPVGPASRRRRSIVRTAEPPCRG